MQEFRIQNLASFMEKLFSTDCFSSFLVESAQFRTAVTWDLDGSLNKRFYSVEEWNDKQQHPYTHSSWTDVRPLCRDLIAGKKVPADFRIVLLLKGEYLAGTLGDSAEAVSSRGLTIRYDGSSAQLITGVSYRTFLPGREADKIWDRTMSRFLAAKGIAFDTALTSRNSV